MSYWLFYSLVHSGMKKCYVTCDLISLAQLAGICCCIPAIHRWAVGYHYKLLPVLEILLMHTIKLEDIVEHL